MNSMIFHHPLPLEINPKRGSRVRPVRMKKAFEDIGWDVLEVTGYGADRKEKISSIKEAVIGGRKITFAYSESSTMPLLLTEKHHFPTYPNLDFGFFKFLNNHNVPIGLFYRDMYWKFPIYQDQLPLVKRVLGKAFYNYEWMRYKSLLHTLFLPSKKMGQLVSYKPTDFELKALPPGCTIPGTDKSQRSTSYKKNSNSLKLFYVGSIVPPMYDLIPAFEIVRAMPGTELLICCREEDWVKWKGRYAEFACLPSVSIVHAHGEELKGLYDGADMFFDVRRPHPYLNYTVPVKIMESIGHGVPVITRSGSETAALIESQDLGWTFRQPEQIKGVLKHIMNSEDTYLAVKKNVLDKRSEHTWEKRASTVHSSLNKAP